MNCEFHRDAQRIIPLIVRSLVEGVVFVHEKWLSQKQLADVIYKSSSKKGLVYALFKYHTEHRLLTENLEEAEQ